MITGIDLNAVTDYTLKEDKKNPTVWKLGALSSDVLAGIASLATVEATSGNIKQMINLVRLGLRGWSNFQIAGKDIAFATVEEELFGAKRQMLDNDIAKIIPLNAIVELGTEIVKINNLSGEEAKN